MGVIVEVSVRLECERFSLHYEGTEVANRVRAALDLPDSRNWWERVVLRKPRRAYAEITDLRMSVLAGSIQLFGSDPWPGFK